MTTIALRTPPRSLTADAAPPDAPSSEFADAESHERLRRWFEVTRHDRSVGLFERNLDTGASTWDDRLCAISGLPPGTPSTTYEQFLTSVVPADRALVLQAWNASIESRQPTSLAYRMLRADGALRWLRADWIVQPDRDGDRIAAGTVRDITDAMGERQRAEEEHAQLLLAADLAQVGLMQQDIQSGELVANSAARVMLGLPEGQAVTLETILEALHPQDRERARMMCVHAPELGEPVAEFACRRLLPDGQVRHLVTRRVAAPIAGVGQDLRRVLHAVVDVTASVEAEQRERRLAQSRAVALDIAQVGVWETREVAGPEGVRWALEFDDRLLAIYGWDGHPRRVDFAAWREAVHPDDRARLDDLRAAVEAGACDASFVEFRIRRPDGELRWLRSNWVRVPAADGAPAMLLGASHDITERRQFEARLRDEHDLLEATSRMAHVGTWRRSVPGGRLYWSSELFSIFRRDPARGMPKLEELASYYEPDSWAGLAYRIEHSVDSASAGDMRQVIRRDDGSRGVVRSWSEVIRGPQGEPVEVRGCLQDITEAEAMRHEVDQVSERMQGLFKEAINGMVLLDDDARYVDANPAACQMLGYTRDELLALRVSDIYVADEAGAFDAIWHRYIDERRQSGRVRLRCKDGRVIPTEYSAVANFQQGLHLSVFSDISQRIETERALFDAQARLRELTLKQESDFEAMRAELARDVHDELGQTLGALKLEIESIVAALPAAVASQLDVGRTRRLLGTAVGQVRDIARALRSPVLDLGLPPALRALGADLSMRGDVDVVVEVPDAAVAALERPTSEAIYRIAQEALTNAMRHADARVVRVALVGGEEGELKLEISDDGCGFDPSGPSARSGLGLLGMRERAHQIGADLRVDSAPGAGTQVHLRVTPRERRRT